MTSLELIDEIEELIMMHQEGSYWVSSGSGMMIVRMEICLLI